MAPSDYLNLCQLIISYVGDMSYSIHLRAIAHEMLKKFNIDFSLKISNLK